MDPCHYLRIVINNLAFRSPTPLNSPSCFCIFKFLHFPHQFAPIPTLQPDANLPDPGPAHSVSACFTLTRSDIDKLLGLGPKTHQSSKRPMLKIDVYSGGSRKVVCGFGSSSGKHLGRVVVPLELSQQVVEGKVNTVIQNGWVLVGPRKIKGLDPELYLNVKVHPDPRFVFEFDCEPQYSPQVFQVQGNIRQPVFSCKFSFRHSGDGNLRSRQRMVRGRSPDRNQSYWS